MATTTWIGGKVSANILALATAKVVTIITQAATAVCTSTAHGFVNGETVLLSNVQGMADVNEKIFRVSNVTANTFDLEGVDSTTFDTFISGSAQKITFTGAFGDLVYDFTISGGEAAEIDATSMSDTVEKKLLGLVGAPNIALTAKLDLANTTLLKLGSYSTAQSKTGFLFTLPNGNKFYVYGLVSAPLQPTGQKGGLVTTPIKVIASSRITSYNI